MAIIHTIILVIIPILKNITHISKSPTGNLRSIIKYGGCSSAYLPTNAMNFPLPLNGVVIFPMGLLHMHIQYYDWFIKRTRGPKMNEYDSYVICGYIYGNNYASTFTEASFLHLTAVHSLKCCSFSNKHDQQRRFIYDNPSPFFVNWILTGLVI